MTFLSWLWLVPVLPFIGAGVMFFVGRNVERRTRGGERFAGIVCSTAMALSLVISAGCVLALSSQPGRRFELHGAEWIAGAEWGLMLDPLSAELMLLVSVIGTLIHIYSIAYMREDRNQYRYFGELNFFVAMMQLLVLANNYLLLFAGWEGVGLASYLLIGFHRERWTAGIAAMKAFIINRAADVGLLLGIIFLMQKAGSANVLLVQASSRQWSDIEITLACALLLVGAAGKSAQFPLHIWLPDAMEGPTPVSALIHSATMVCAGVYLIARSSFLFAHAPEVSVAVAIIGTVTAFLAATVALVENDIKRVLAYSTVSQIGFMFVALGAQAYTAALFHLFTHAFFKSLLFLGSGSLIHALHGEQNLNHMGGLRRRMPATFLTMLVACAALSAVPGFAGFFSKDDILGETFRLPNGWIFELAGLATSLLTACYAWRLMFLAFFGSPRSAAAERAHESPNTMVVPMYLLAFGSVFAGWIPALIHWYEWPLMIVSALLAFAGIALAWRFYVVIPESRSGWSARFRPLVSFLRNRWYIDALYEEHFLNGIVLRAANGAAAADTRGIDRLVNLSGRLARIGSRAFTWTDTWIVDGCVRFSSNFLRACSSPARALQSGLVQTYALFFIAGLLIALGYYLNR
jgi:NADH-quinone oxidoreductase subunit L